MNPSHYPQVTRPRSRSPSPNLHHQYHGNDEKASGNDNVLNVPGEEKSRSVSHFDRRGRQSQGGSRVSQDGQSDHDERSQGHGHWRKKYRTYSGSSDGDRELLTRGSRSSSRHMDDRANQTRNYGSLNDEDVPLIRDYDSDSAIPRRDLSEPREVKFSGSHKSCYTPAMVDELRKRNQLYFMDPITKLVHFHGFPWKLTFQILKVILITYQVLIFGGQRENIVEYFERGALAYKHLLLLNWDVSFETMPYPPATGQYAVYSFEELTAHLNNAVVQYYQVPKKSLASIHHIVNSSSQEILPVTLCYRTNSFIEFPNGSYIVSGNIISECIELQPGGSPDNYTFDIMEFLQSKNKTIAFNQTFDLGLKMKFHSFHLNLVETHYGPTCYNINVKITYENTDRSGQLVIDLDTTPVEIDCIGRLADQVVTEMNDLKTKVIALDVVVMCLCVVSTVLCSRSLSRSNSLRRTTSRYFRVNKGKSLSFSSQMEYINLWYVTIICNDILTIVGSAFKIQLESRIFSITSENYAVCSIFLGLGIFLSYASLLRYLSFFKSYNVLILTLKTSFPHVVRFLVCAICLYTGFLFCGWVVFSPYHIKFRRLSTSSECLFSLVNGDDMFVTFSALTNDSSPIWYFQRCYLYVFISIFIYVVLSVFIAVIMDNYENLKFYYEKGFPDTDIQRFINEEGELQKSELFSHVKRGTRCERCFFCLFPCFSCFRREPKRPKVSKDQNQFLASI